MAGQDPGSPEIYDGKEMVGSIIALEQAALLRVLTKQVSLARAMVLAQTLVQWEGATLVFSSPGCFCNVCLASECLGFCSAGQPVSSLHL